MVDFLVLVFTQHCLSTPERLRDAVEADAKGCGNLHRSRMKSVKARLAAMMAIVG